MKSELHPILLNDCKTCDGKGIISIDENRWLRCKKCMGKGKLDWIENIVGPTQDIPSDYKLVGKVLLFADSSNEGEKIFLNGADWLYETSNGQLQKM